MTQQVVPPGFHFSQSSLQDYVDCPRRFELRHILRQAWPAVQVQPVWEHERQMWRGTAFHRLVHQHAVGIPVEILTESIEDDDLSRWWQAYLNAPPSGLPERVRLSEVTLYAPIGEYRLVAKYDWIAADDERVIIVDWKTNRKRPASAWLLARLQSRVYPYIVVEAGASALQIKAVSPGQVSMIYWFAEDPHRPAPIAYSRTQHQENGHYLPGLVSEIVSHAAGSFPLTSDERHCRFCVYRSLCERDFAAGNISDMDRVETDADWSDWDVDMEQIVEIAY